MQIRDYLEQCFNSNCSHSQQMVSKASAQNNSLKLIAVFKIGYD